MIHAVPRFAAAFVLLLSAAVPALAVDGVHEIDQSCALSGCFAGDAPGFPVQISEDGSYRLTSNLDAGDPAVTVISILSNTVTLDLNGFVIRNGFSCGIVPSNCPPFAGDGIHITTAWMVTIRNGGISNVGHDGIFSANATTIVEEVTLNTIGGRGIDASTGHLTFRQSSIIDTGGDGIHAHYAKVLDSRVAQTRGDGIEIEDRGWVWGVETSNTLTASLRLTGKLAGYAMCRLDRTPLNGVNLGQNMCADGFPPACPP
jgi:hypothetical protein